MRNNRRIALNIVYIIIGIVLIIVTEIGKLDSMYTGFGGGLLVVGILNMFRSLRYKKDENYRENVDTAIGDERNNFLRMKAWSWAGYIFVIILAVITIICMILSLELYMQIAAYALCLIVLLYWISYTILKRRY